MKLVLLFLFPLLGFCQGVFENHTSYLNEATKRTGLESYKIMMNDFYVYSNFNGDVLK